MIVSRRRGHIQRPWDDSFCAEGFERTAQHEESRRHLTDISWKNALPQRSRASPLLQPSNAQLSQQSSHSTAKPAMESEVDTFTSPVSRLPTTLLCSLIRPLRFLMFSLLIWHSALLLLRFHSLHPLFRNKSFGRLVLLLFHWGHFCTSFKYFWQSQTFFPPLLVLIGRSIRILALVTWTELLFFFIFFSRTFGSGCNGAQLLMPKPRWLLWQWFGSFSNGSVGKYPAAGSYRYFLNVWNLLVYWMLGSVASLAVYLALHPFFPGDLELLNSSLLGLVFTLRRFRIPWTTNTNSCNSRPVEAAFGLTLFILTPLLVILRFVPGFHNCFRIFGLVTVLPNLPMLLLTQLEPAAHHALLHQLVAFVKRLFRIIITNYIVFGCLNCHDLEGYALPATSLFKTVQELEHCLSESKFFSYCLAIIKMDLYSRNAPRAFPQSFQVCSATKAQDRETSAAREGSLQLPMFPANSVTTTSVVWSASSLEMPSVLMPIYIAESSGHHALLSLTPPSTDVSKQSVPSVGFVGPPTRYHPAALAALPLNTAKRPSSGSSSTNRLSDRLFRRTLFVLMHKGVCGIMKDLTNKTFKGLSRCLLLCSPSWIHRCLADVVNNKTDHDLATFLFRTRSPIRSLGVDSGFFVNSIQSCQRSSCDCANGVVLNYWVYATLLSSPSTKIWTFYTAAGAALSEGLYNTLVVVRLLSSRSAATEELEQTGFCTLGLDVLVNLEAVYRFVELRGSDIQQQLAFERTSRLAVMVRRGTQLLSNKTLTPSSCPSTENCLRMNVDFTTRLSSADYQHLQLECFYLAQLLLDLALPFCRGWTQWCHIATLLKRNDQLRASVRQLIPLFIKLTEELRFEPPTKGIPSASAYHVAYAALRDETRYALDTLSQEYSACFTPEGLAKVEALFGYN